MKAFLLFQLEKEAKLLHPPKSPNTSHSNNSTLENKPKTGIKKIITDKIITSTTLERNKKEKKDATTLERENEKNVKLANKTRYSDVPVMNKPERNKNRHSTGSDVQIIVPDNNGIAHQEHAEVQKKDYDPKRGMKFGIRVLPPNVPDDGVLKHKNDENGVVAVERKSLDDIDKPETQRPASTTQIKHESEVEQKKPVVAKRREKMAPPIPNARVKTNESDVSNISMSRSDINTSRTSEVSLSSFERNDLNSSGIKRDENGIPQELPQHMMDAARAARTNRKSSADLVQDKERPEAKKEEAPKPEYRKEEAPKPETKKEEALKAMKKSKGKAPSPPDAEKNKTDDSIIEQLQNVNDFLSNEKQHSSLLYDSSITSPNTTTTTASYMNTSTPKVNKTKSVISNLSRAEESINFSQDDIDDIVTKPFRRENDSLNNFFEDSKSNLSSNQDGHSIMSFNHSDKSEKGSTTIELNNSDITIHSSPLNDTVHSASDDTSLLDENERKAQSLGDLSRFELRTKTNKPSTGTLERAQSLDISAEEAESQENTISPKKRKAMSVVETTFFESSNDDVLPDMIDSDKSAVNKHKEPRLSLNLAKSSAMEGLSTFQRNRLKKGSEFGNLEDAIVKGSNSSIDSERNDEIDSSNIRSKNFESYKESEHETSDNLARRIMDENLKVHLKLVSEFAKSTSDGSNSSSLDSSQEAQPPTTKITKTETSPTKYEEKLTMLTDTNIPDDVKVSRNTYVNSLERPKSEMMKKLLAKNPILNVHIDQGTQKTEASTSNTNKESSTLMTDNLKSLHQPDIVNFDLKPQKELLETKPKGYDDFVSNIRVGSNNNSFKNDKKPTMTSFKSEWSEPKQISTTTNVVTITTEKNKPEEQKVKSYTKSIEIGEPMMRVMPPDVLEGIRKHGEKEQRTLYMEPANMSITMTQDPVQKTVTVNTTEDEFGNKVITQNVEKISTKYITTKAEAPLQVEQFSFGFVRNPGEIDELTLEEGDVKDIDKRVLDEIKRQNPNMHFTTDDPAYTRTETIILNTTDMDEEQAKALMAKLQNDPTFMAQKTPEELSKLGIRIIQDLEDVQTSNEDAVEVTKTRYSINPAKIAETQKYTRIEGPEKHKEHITEIQVVTPRTEMKQKSEVTEDKFSSRQRAPPDDLPLSYELDVELLNDFILNERHHSAKQQDEANKRTKPNNEPKKRHSDFDLPRNSHIKFRTATYESPKGTIVTSTDLENRRLSQLDQQLRVEQAAKPALLAKPSNIPVKSEKTKVLGVGISSKIPIFSTQKSLSQENLSESRFSLPRSPPPQFSSSGNISVTSIKSSSRSPSGGKLL